MKKIPLPSSLNICMVANKFPILGRATDHGFLWPIARGLAKKGHNITILAWKNPQGKKEILQDNVQAYFLERPYSTQAEDFPKLVSKKFNQLHQQKNFHLVHSIDDSAHIIGGFKKKLRVALMYDVEATKMTELFSLMGISKDTVSGRIKTGLRVAYKFVKTFLSHDRPLLRSAGGVFVTSPQQKMALERHYLYPEYRTYSVPYGIEVGDLSPREKSDELRKSLNLPSNIKTLVTVTDMTEPEVIKNILLAFKKVAIKKPSTRLIIVGDGPLRKEVEFTMLNLALGSRVLLVGQVSATELSDYIALSDAFINLSAKTSGFEPSLLEAMAQKKVIIGSEVSPISTIVDDGKDGFLIRPADVSSLSQLLIDVFTEQVSSEQIGENARSKVINLFDTEKMVDQTLRAYYKTLKDTGYYKHQTITSHTKVEANKSSI